MLDYFKFSNKELSNLDKTLTRLKSLAPLNIPVQKYDHFSKETQTIYLQLIAHKINETFLLEAALSIKNILEKVINLISDDEALKLNAQMSKLQPTLQNASSIERSFSVHSLLEKMYGHVIKKNISKELNNQQSELFTFAKNSYNHKNLEMLEEFNQKLEAFNLLLAPKDEEYTKEFLSLAQRGFTRLSKKMLQQISKNIQQIKKIDLSGNFLTYLPHDFLNLLSKHNVVFLMNGNLIESPPHIKLNNLGKQATREINNDLIEEKLLNSLEALCADYNSQDNFSKLEFQAKSFDNAILINQCLTPRPVAGEGLQSLMNDTIFNHYIKKADPIINLYMDKLKQLVEEQDETKNNLNNGSGTSSTSKKKK